MNLLNSDIAREHQKDIRREIEHDAQAREADQDNKSKPKSRPVRVTVGTKLVEWGERLQESDAAK